MNWKPLLIVALPTLAMLLLDKQHSLSHEALVGETIDQLDGPGYFGLVSNFTIAFWLLGGACACLAAAVLARGTGARRESALFLGAFGVWTLWLGFDDAYVVHEEFFPDKVGISQAVVSLIYVIVTAAMIWRFRRQLINADLPLLVCALVVLAASQGVDQFLKVGAHNFLEESLKMIGVFAWSGYFALRSASLLRAELAPQ
jgi:hypothetical protein